MRWSRKLFLALSERGKRMAAASVGEGTARKVGKTGYALQLHRPLDAGGLYPRRKCWNILLVDTSRTRQLEIYFGGEIVPFPAAARKVRRRRTKCPCQCALIKTSLLRHALAFLTLDELAVLDEELRRLRFASSSKVSGETSGP